MNDQILVWDKLVRSFHWLLLIAFVASYVTGEEESDLHFYSGYLILGLLAIRVAWGFIGPENARFASFLRPIPETIAYLRGLITGNSKRYIGHNPAAGLMGLALICSVFCTAASGLTLYGLEGHGPLAFIAGPSVSGQEMSEQGAYDDGTRDHDDDDDDSYDDDDDWREDDKDHRRRHHEEDEEHEREERSGDERAYDHDEGESKESTTGDHHEDDPREEFWEEVHEFFVNLTILLILLHVAGVIASSLRHGENLVKSMFTGYKNP